MILYWDILKLLLNTRSIKVLLGACVVSMAFSMAVILCAVGIMNGYEDSLLNFSKSGNGEIFMHPINGFVSQEEARLINLVDKKNIKEVSKIRQIEAFIMNENTAQGILVKGIDPHFFSVTQISFALQKNDIALSAKLAQKLNLKIGQEVAISFAKGNEQFSELPTTYRVRLKSIINHGIYEKDMRYVYMNEASLFSLLGIAPHYNLFEIKIAGNDFSKAKVLQQVDLLNKRYGDSFFVYPFWHSYKNILEAVEVEKFIIAVILQIIVVVSIFNIVAFIYYLRSKKAADFFLMRVLGFSYQKTFNLWYFLNTIIWFLSCILALFFVFVTNHFILKMVRLPADIYVLDILKVDLAFGEYALVFLGVLFFVYLVTYFIVRKMKSQSIITRLREETI